MPERGFVLDGKEISLPNGASMTPVSPLPVDLHGAIMNLPCTMPVADVKTKGATLANVAYRVGHRDARRAAAVLASAHEVQHRAEIDRLTKSREELREALYELVAIDTIDDTTSYVRGSRWWRAWKAARAALSGPEASA